MVSHWTVLSGTTLSLVLCRYCKLEHKISGMGCLPVENLVKIIGFSWAGVTVSPHRVNIKIGKTCFAEPNTLVSFAGTIATAKYHNILTNSATLIFNLIMLLMAPLQTFAAFKSWLCDTHSRFCSFQSPFVQKSLYIFSKYLKHWVKLTRRYGTTYVKLILNLKGTSAIRIGTCKMRQKIAILITPPYCDSEFLDCAGYTLHFDYYLKRENNTVINVDSCGNICYFNRFQDFWKFLRMWGHVSNIW